jgi:hypothetical protein
MTKKKQHGAILSCDPSFRNCAFVLYYPGENIELGETYDLTQDFKRYDGFPKIVVLIHDLLAQLWKDFDPYLCACTVFVVETQFHKSMERLVNCLTAAFYEKFRESFPEVSPPLKMIGSSAKYWRKHYGIMSGNYRQRKQSSVNYVNSRRPQLICGNLGTNDDNRCEAILILNYAVEQHGLEFSSEMSQVRRGRQTPQTQQRTTRVYVGDGAYCDVGFTQKCTDCRDKNYYIALSAFEDNAGQPYFKCSACKKSGGVLDYDQTEMVKDAVAESYPDVEVAWYPPKETKSVGKQRPAPRTKAPPKTKAPANDSLVEELRAEVAFLSDQVERLKSDMDFIKTIVTFRTTGTCTQEPTPKKPKRSYVDASETFPSENSDDEMNGA